MFHDTPKPLLGAWKRTVNISSDLGGVCEQFLILVLFASVCNPKAVCEQKRLEIHLSTHLKERFTFLLSSLH